MAPRDISWRELLEDLVKTPSDIEIIFASTEEKRKEDQEFLAAVVKSHPRVAWVVSPRGRAQQMNLAAKSAVGEYLFFLHADNRLSGDACDDLLQSFESHPESLFFFRLKFQGDGPLLMRLNEWGVQLRAEWLGMPFGDQGFAIKKSVFQKLGGYSEECNYGEDHLFAWKVRQSGRSLRCLKTSIYTSARKYRQKGWAVTTVQHVILTALQATPEAWIWAKSLWHNRQDRPCK